MLRYLGSFSVATLVGFSFLCVATSSLAQEAKPPERFADIPKDSVGLMSLDLGKVRASKDFQLWPWEILDVAAREQFGVDLNDIEAIDGMVLMPSPEPEFGISIRTKRGYDIAKLPEQMFTPVQSSPKDTSGVYRDVMEAPMIRVLQLEPTRVLVGTQGALRRMTSSRLKSGGDFVGLVQNSTAAMRLAVNLQALRDVTSGFLLNPESGIPPQLTEDIQRILSLTDNALIEMHPDQQGFFQVSVGTGGTDKAKLVHQSMLRIRQEMEKTVEQSFFSDIDQNTSISPVMKQAMRSYVARLRDAFGNDDLVVENERVAMKVDRSLMSTYSGMGVMVGLLLPAVQAAREAARRMEGGNNLRQIMLALHNFHEATRRFPPQAISDENGKPLLSWRVAILPYLGEDALYREFHLDEPWDSPHNVKLIQRMPAVFVNPSNPPQPGMTTYVIPSGDGVGLGAKGIRLAEITDGTSMTLAILDVNPSMGIAWTKPDTLSFRIFETREIQQYIRQPGFNAAFFDGSVRWLTSQVDIQLLRAMFTRNGGEVLPGIP